MLAIFSRASSSISRVLRPVCSRNGTATFSVTVSELNNAPCWNNTPQRRRNAAYVGFVSWFGHLWPKISMSPAVGCLQ